MQAWGAQMEAQPLQLPQQLDASFSAQLSLQGTPSLWAPQQQAQQQQAGAPGGAFYGAGAYLQQPQGDALQQQVAGVVAYAQQQQITSPFASQVGAQTQAHAAIALALHGCFEHGDSGIRSGDILCPGGIVHDSGANEAAVVDGVMLSGHLVLLCAQFGMAAPFAPQQQQQLQPQLGGTFQASPFAVFPAGSVGPEQQSHVQHQSEVSCAPRGRECGDAVCVALLVL